VLTHVPVSRSQLYAMAAAGRFPKPIHLGGSASFWVESEIVEWLDAQIAAERAISKNQVENPVLHAKYALK
jgi:prophage regulatory protein